MEGFITEVTYLEYLQKERCMNDNHVFHNNELQEEKEIQLPSAYRRLPRDTTFKPGRAKLVQEHDRTSLQVKCQ